MKTNKVIIYQLDGQRTEENVVRNVLFEEYERAKEYLKRAYYRAVYTTEMAITKQIERVMDDLFIQFNVNRPTNFKGHSLSIGDVIYVENYGYYYVNDFGFKKINETDTNF